MAENENYYQETIDTLNEGASVVQENISVSDVVVSVPQTLADPIGDLAQRAGDTIAEHLEGNHNVILPEGIQTMIGTSFSNTLCTSLNHDVQRTASDGSSYNGMTVNNSYDSSMISFHLEQDVDYNSLSERNRMVYEITLLSKHYGNQYLTASEEARKNLATEYQGYLEQYRTLCDGNDELEWNSILGDVSIELQEENAYYGNKLNKQDEQAVANAGHTLMVDATKDYFVDFVPASLQNQSRDDSMDLNPAGTTLFGSTGILAPVFEAAGKKIKAWFVNFKEQFIASRDVVLENASDMSYINEMDTTGQINNPEQMMQAEISNDARVESQYQQAVAELGGSSSETPQGEDGYSM